MYQYTFTQAITQLNSSIDHKTVYESNLSHVKVNQEKEKRGKQGHHGSKPQYHLS